MLTKRIIPCLDSNKGRVVKGTSFVNLKDAGDPKKLAKFYNDEGADELVFLDITASHEKRDTFIEVVEQVSSEVFIPLTVGGGVKTIENISQLLNAGADKVSINTSGIKNPNFIKIASKKFGSQCIVSAIDVKRVGGSWNVFVYGGRNDTGLNGVEWAKECVKLGAGEILLTSMDSDGQKQGYDLDLLKEISKNVSVPVIASGGAGNLDHIYQAINVGKADAVLAASIFHYGELKIKDVKDFLNSKDIPVRL